MIQSAYRRRLFVLGVEQLALALAVLFAAATLMLLLGTQIFQWYWVALLALTGLAVALVRFRRCLLPKYRVAQIVDRRLELCDSLSTACFLLSEGNRRDDPMTHLQMERVAASALGFEISRAIPFTGERVWALTAALAGVMFGLFAVRYLMTSTLNLQPALIPIHLPAVWERVENSLSSRDNAERAPSPLDARQETLQRTGAAQAGRSGTAQETELAGKFDRAGAGQLQQQRTDSQPNDNSHPGQSAGSPSSPAGAQKTGGQKAAEAAKNQRPSEQDQKTSEQSASGEQGSSGLLDKMKDALSSLMAKMRPDQNSSKEAQNGQRAADDRKSGNQGAASKGRDGDQQDARKQQGNQDHSAEQQAQGQTTEKGQSGQGQNSDQSAEKGSDAHSGIGRQDGDKDVKEAEQLRAMGKLAEIIGKRSASITGEMMVETASGKQQLKTDYSHRLGHHSDLGGEINRDEIPLADRQYIREYMELVRKQGKTGQ